MLVAMRDAMSKISETRLPSRVTFGSKTDCKTWSVVGVRSAICKVDTGNVGTSLAEKGARVVQRVVAKRLRTQLQRQLSSFVSGKDRRAGFGTTCIYVDEAK